MSAARWISVAELAEMTGSSPATVKRWMSRGVAPKWRKLPNRRILFDSRDLEDWLDALVVQ